MSELVLPITSKCPIGGEEWPTESYKSTCDTFPPNGNHSAKTVHFICPAQHLFSLGEAVRAKMFTQGQKKLIVQQAQVFWESKLALWR